MYLLGYVFKGIVQNVFRNTADLIEHGLIQPWTFNTEQNLLRAKFTELLWWRIEKWLHKKGLTVTKTHWLLWDTDRILEAPDYNKATFWVGGECSRLYLVEICVK